MDFTAVSLVKLSGVCQSLICGYPLLLRPRSATAATEQLNQRRGAFLIDFLRQQGLAVVASPDANGCPVVLMPAARDNLLVLKTLLPSDLLLPLPPVLPVEKANDIADGGSQDDDCEVDMSSALGKLETLGVFSPGDHTTGVVEEAAEAMKKKVSGEQKQESKAGRGRKSTRGKAKYSSVID